MGQSNVLLRIYYVKDFPLHTLLLEIRKGYFMEPENKFATAEEKDEREYKYNIKIELCSIKSSANKERAISKGPGESFKDDCILLFFPSFFLPPSPPPCFKSLLGLSSATV